MSENKLQIISIALVLVFSALIIWLYANQPQNLQEVVSKAAVSAGTYTTDGNEFRRGIDLFRQKNFTGARESFAKADPEKRDANVQFYTAYSFYREGFGIFSSNDTLFKQGLEAVDIVIALNPDLKSADENLKIKTPQELKAELQEGVEKTWGDLNPFKLLREKK